MDTCAQFKALGDPVRAAIAKAVCCKALSVGQIVARFNLSQPAISHHLRILRQAGVLTAEKRGTTIFYSLNKECLSSLCCCVRKDYKIEEE